MSAVPNAAQRWSLSHFEAILRLIDEALDIEPAPRGRARSAEVDRRGDVRNTA
jgi:hypothetical protein